MTDTFTAPNGTVFYHNTGCSGDAHIAPAVGEPSVEVPIDDLVAFVAHVETERERKRGRTRRGRVTQTSPDGACGSWTRAPARPRAAS